MNRSCHLQSIEIMPHQSLLKTISMPLGRTRQCLFLLLVTIVSIQPCVVRATVGHGALPTQNVTVTYLERTLNALQGALDFFQKHHDKVNLDAVIGTRMVEGSLKVLLENLERTHQSGLVPIDIVNHIRTLHNLAKTVSDDAEPNVLVSEPKYYQRIGPTIHEGLWELNYSRRTLSRNVAMWPYTPEEAMTEKESDDCLTELFGTTGRTDEPCVISDKCWRRMTSYGYSQYSLSHEIFYLQIGEQTGCLPQIVWAILTNGQPTVHELQDTFCANMLREAVSIVNADYPTSHQDLFMEQALLCGMYGYWEFFHYDWLEKILSWQDTAKGCFGWAGWPEHRLRATQHHMTKREERRLDNGCLCHRTTVAAGALAQYVRFLVEGYLEGTKATQNVTE